ncbi:hypothetical protein ADK57_25190 [Streptomyces sp. MMG1533]|nr:hypothetical protein ADK57_25190 [Streptomyces sp. MMG1533]
MTDHELIRDDADPGQLPGAQQIFSESTRGDRAIAYDATEEPDGRSVPFFRCHRRLLDAGKFLEGLLQIWLVQPAPTPVDPSLRSIPARQHTVKIRPLHCGIPEELFEQYGNPGDNRSRLRRRQAVMAHLERDVKNLPIIYHRDLSVDGMRVIFDLDFGRVVRRGVTLVQHDVVEQHALGSDSGSYSVHAQDTGIVMSVTYGLHGGHHGPPERIAKARGSAVVNSQPPELHQIAYAFFAVGKMAVGD